MEKPQTQPLRPMDLPELRPGVGQYLNRLDLLSCIRVAKAWHASFVPLIYHTLDLQVEKVGTQTPRGQKRLPSRETLRRYGSHLRDLTIDLPSPFFFDLYPAVTHLKSLRIRTEDSRCTGDGPSGETEAMFLMDTNTLMLERFEYEYFWDHNNDRKQKLFTITEAAFDFCAADHAMTYYLSALLRSSAPSSSSSFVLSSKKSPS